MTLCYVRERSGGTAAMSSFYTETCFWLYLGPGVRVPNVGATVSALIDATALIIHLLDHSPDWVGFG